MSSILKALKKLEGEEISGNYSHSIPPINTRKAITNKAKSTWLLGRILTMLSAGGFIVICVWIALHIDPEAVSSLFKQKPQPAAVQKPVTPDNTQMKHARTKSRSADDDKTTPASSPEPIPEKPVQIKDNPDVRTAGKKTIPPRIESIPNDNLTLSEAQLSSSPVPKNIEENPAPKSDEKKVEAPSERIVAKKPVIYVEPAPGPEEIDDISNIEIEMEMDATWEEPQAEPEMPPSMTDSRFKLQALVWSEKPESRFIVINNKILRIGGDIDGVIVTRIENDYVILKEGEDRWKLDF